MKILVVGSNGYIGRHVVDYLIKKKIEVIAVDVNNDYTYDCVKYINASVFDDIDVISEIAKDVECCIYLAWRNGFIHNDDSHIEELSSHYKVLKKLIDDGVKQLAIMGTMHEIGYWEGAIDENTPCNPASKYGIAKNALRQLILEYSKGKKTIIKWLRGYYITGDDLRSNSIFAKILKAEKEKKETFPFTSGKNKYDFIDIDEFAKQIVTASIQTDVDGIINCCSGNPISLAERVEKFISDNNLKIRLEYGAYPDRDYDSPGVWGDNTKISKIMNNNPI